MQIASQSRRNSTFYRTADNKTPKRTISKDAIVQKGNETNRYHWIPHTHEIKKACTKSCLPQGAKYQRQALMANNAEHTSVISSVTFLYIGSLQEHKENMNRVMHFERKYKLSEFQRNLAFHWKRKTLVGKFHYTEEDLSPEWRMLGWAAKNTEPQSERSGIYEAN